METIERWLRRFRKMVLFARAHPELKSSMVWICLDATKWVEGEERSFDDIGEDGRWYTFIVRWQHTSPTSLQEHQPSSNRKP